METTNGINIVTAITQTINNLFSNLFSSIDNNLYSALDDLLFINTDIMHDTYFKNIFGTYTSDGLILICNSLLIGITIYYSVSLIISYFTFCEVQSPYQFIFKIIICMIAINFSFYLCEKVILLISYISSCIRGLGENLFNKEICFSLLIQNINSRIYLENTSANFLSLDGLIKSFTSLGFLNLALSYALRYIMIKVFILICPFAILSLILKNSSWIFKSWTKIFFSLLLLQIFVSIIFLITFSLNFSSDNIFSKLIYVGSIYALVKANSFIKEFMGGISTDISLGLSNIKSLLKN